MVSRNREQNDKVRLIYLNFQTYLVCCTITTTVFSYNPNVFDFDRESLLLHVHGWIASESVVNRLVWNQSLCENNKTEAESSETLTNSLVAVSSGNRVRYQIDTYIYM